MPSPSKLVVSTPPAVSTPTGSTLYSPVDAPALLAQSHQQPLSYSPVQLPVAVPAMAEPQHAQVIQSHPSAAFLESYSHLATLPEVQHGARQVGANSNLDHSHSDLNNPLLRHGQPHKHQPGENLESPDFHGIAAEPQSPDSYNYANLTDGILSHVFFPLVLKKAFEHFTDAPLPVSQSATHFGILEQRSAELKNYAQLCGLEGACEKYASVDLFMSAMVTSLSSLSDRVKSGAIDPLLADTLAVASATMQNGRQAEAHHSVRAGNGGQPGFGGAIINAAGTSLEVPSVEGFPKPGRPSPSTLHTNGPEPAITKRKLSREARACLERWFQDNLESPYPNDSEKHVLARTCNLEVQQVNNYFGNKRMRMKRKMMQIQPDDAASVPGISSAGSPVLHQTLGKTSQRARTESVLAPQSKWKDVVLSRLQAPGAQKALGVKPLLVDTYKHQAPSLNAEVVDEPSNEPGFYTTTHDSRQSETQRQNVLKPVAKLRQENEGNTIEGLYRAETKDSESRS